MQNAIIDVPVNVKNAPFNAIGDGVHDDTSSILDAIEYVAAKGGTVDLPAGAYSVSKPIWWDYHNVFLRGDGGARIIARPGFQGNAVIAVGTASKALSPTIGGGISNLIIDLNQNSNEHLVGVQLIQAWFTHIELLKIANPKGLSQVRQTAFQISAGALEESADLANWACNINVYNLQITGSFKTCLSHVSGCSNPVKAQVNGVNYFGGFAFGAGKDRAGSSGARLETGDSTRVYGFALEDFEVGCFIGTQNQGPLDFRLEDCARKFVLAPGIKATIPAIGDIVL